MGKQQRFQIADIQVLRGIAVLLVILQHWSITPTLLGFFPRKISMPFYSGVELFFVISGFVITLSLMKNHYNVPAFLIKRIFRLTPAVVCFVLVSAGVRGMIAGQQLSDWAKATFVTPMHQFLREGLSVVAGYFLFISNGSSYYNGAMWSLSVEDQFYITFALVIALITIFYKTTHKITGAIAWIAGSVYVACLLVRLSCLFWPQVVPSYPQVLLYITGWRFDFIALGVLLAYAFDRRKGPFKATATDRQLYSSPWMFCIPLGLLSLMDDSLTGLAQAPLLSGIGYPLTGICFMVLVRNAANNMAFTAREGRVYQFLAYVGDRSYAYYLFQFPVFAITWLLVLKFDPAAFSSAVHYGVVQMVVSAFILYYVVEFIYNRVELPMTALGRRLAERVTRKAKGADQPSGPAATV
jgi:peptidoglycan/LPS O-acetylase OafA/YrhL